MYDQGNKDHQTDYFRSILDYKIRSGYFLLACFVLGCASLAQADIIVTNFRLSNQSWQSYTDFSGSRRTSLRIPSTIGTFNFMIPAGDQVASATISGTFGDENFSTSALTDLFVDNGNINSGRMRLPNAILAPPALSMDRLCRGPTPSPRQN